MHKFTSIYKNITVIERTRYGICRLMVPVNDCSLFEIVVLASIYLFPRYRMQNVIV